MTAFGDAPALPGWVRLLLGIVATTHALLCVRVIFIRLVRVNTEPAHPERVPTAAMVAYGILTANIARILLVRLPEGAPLVWESVIAYTGALIAGSIAFTQIVVLVRRDRRKDLPQR